MQTRRWSPSPASRLASASRALDLGKSKLNHPPVKHGSRVGVRTSSEEEQHSFSYIVNVQHAFNGLFSLH